MSKTQSFKIAITTTSFAKYGNEPLALLDANGFEVVFNPYDRKLNNVEIFELCKGAVGIIAGTEMYDAEVLQKLAQSSLKVISRCGTGLDNIDLEAAKRLGIKVFNTPDAPTLAVAELTVGLILDLLRRVTMMDREMRAGIWQKRMGNLLSGKIVGIIGFGRIGQKVAQLLMSFNCQIVFYDLKSDYHIEHAKYVNLDELLKISDIVSIHVSSNKQIIGAKEVAIMKKGSWLVNVSRGGVVDEDALYQALKDGYLAGVALDVYEQEPYTGQLKELDNVVLTPHIGSYAKESRIDMEMQAVQNLLKGLMS